MNRTAAQVVAALVVAAVLAACGGGKKAMPDGGPPPGDGGERPKYLERLASPTDFALLQGAEGEVNYLGKAGRGLPPLDRPCMFQDSARYPRHITFIKSFPELAHIDFDAYLNLVMKNATRVLWAGSLVYVSTGVHPRTKARGVLAYFIYADDAVTEALTVEQIQEVDARLKGCVPYARDLLVLVGMNRIQADRFAAQASTLATKGVDVIDPAALRPADGAEGYSLGEGYGFLRIVPAGVKASDYSPRDVLVTESPPEDLSLVAGLVSSLPQNLHSHVNLRLREKMIPNARVPDIYQNRVVSLLDGKLVHITVEEHAVRIEPALLETAMAFWADHRPHVDPPAADLAETRLRPFEALRATDATSVGTKAANLGELTQVLPAGNRVVGGFGIPFAAYRDFMRDTGLAPKLEALLADPRLDTDGQFRRAALDLLRDAIEGATVPAGLAGQIAEMVRGTFGTGAETLPVRFRSSSNVEDGAHISGAGLHDSARGCLADDLDGDDAGPSRCLAADERADLEAQLAARQAEYAAHPERDWLPGIIQDLGNDLFHERGVARALKKVYASLWNDRAFEERAYWGIDHWLAYMGVAVEPSFVLEKLDAVAVTNLEAGDGGPLYRVVSQGGRQGVVRPADPTLVAETVTWRRGPGDQPTDVRVVNFSSLSPMAPLWSDPQLGELAGLLFGVHDHFATKVYPALAHPSFDLEIKLTRDDRIVIKQVRPYLQTNPF
jgi:hypothetical protein